MAALPLSDPYAAIATPTRAPRGTQGAGGKQASAPADDPYAHLATPTRDAAPPQPYRYTGPTGGTIQASPAPTLMQRIQGTVANSAIGHSLEQTLPYVADKLGLHPTETVNSPTYQADKGQILAPQYLIPENPTTKLGNLGKGVLRGVGQLTSGQNLSIGAGVAASGGLIAPLLPEAGLAGAVASYGSKAARLGMAAAGAHGVYQDGKGVVSKLNAGDTNGAFDAAGAALPNALITLPAMGEPLQATGEALQGAGVNTMDSLLKAGKKAYRYDAQPGLGVLQEGPGTSLAMSKAGLYQSIQDAKDRAGSEIPGIIQNSTASIPRATLKTIVDSTIDDKSNVLRGAGGNLGALPSLQDLSSTFDQHVNQPGEMSAGELYGIKRNIDDNINYGRNVDPLDATANNARRAIRGGASDALYEAVPELRGPSQRFQNLSSAETLAEARTFDQSGSSPFLKAGAGVLTGGFAHRYTDPLISSAIGLGTAIGPTIAKSVPMRTALATSLFQGGKGLAASGRFLQNIGAIDPLEPSSGYPATIQEAASDGKTGTETTPQSAFNYAHPSSSPYSLTNLTPEIISPDSQSRSRFPMGSDGRGGVMVRPLGALPAPAPPIPQPEPYIFNPKPPTAIPERSAATLAQSIGSRANVLPSRLLSTITTSGSDADQGAALRQASLGSTPQPSLPPLLTPPTLSAGPTPLPALTPSGVPALTSLLMKNADGTLALPNTPATFPPMRFKKIGEQ